MSQALLKISLIILTNLLAFMSVGLILDALFKAEGIVLLASVLVSLPCLGLIMYFKAGKIFKELQNIKEK